MELRHSLARMWRFGGTIDRGTYLALGVGLFVLKCSIDYTLAEYVFGGHWTPYYYLAHGQAYLALTATDEMRPFYAVALCLSVPFVWMGVALTVKRLRSADLPIWLVFLFFVPLLNWPFLFMLCALPSVFGTTGKPTETATISPAPAPSVPSAVLAIVFTGLVGFALTGFDVYGLGTYGLGLFVGMPFCLGMIAAVLHGFRRVRSPGGCIGVAIGGVMMAGALLLSLGAEGGVCLVMASPVWLFCAMLGGSVGCVVQKHARDQRGIALAVVLLSLAIPALMGAEYAFLPESKVYAVRSAVDVDAESDAVWNSVVSFPELPPPDEWIFRAGVAFPTGAIIHGEGVGAERHCVFSTGSFIEPIEVWDEPRLLKFSVRVNPPPMKEWSFHGEIHPPHLDGFLVSKAGQFLLTPLEGGGTRLEGTTWYQHNMWPAMYWRWWSDYMIHKIHLRVLRHVKQLCEDDGPHLRAGEATAQNEAE